MSARQHKYVFRDILAFFPRLDLYYLSFSCRRFKDLINLQFSNAPYLQYQQDLVYGSDNNGTWTCETNSKVNSVHQCFMEQLPVLKFIRFDQSRFHCNSLSVLETTILPISHVWQGRKLDICCNHFSPPICSISHFKTASILCMTCNFDNTMTDVLQEILTGSCEEVILYLTGNIDECLKLPITETLDFLFRPVTHLGQNANILHRKLHLVTSKLPNLRIRNGLLASVEQAPTVLMANESDKIEKTISPGLCGLTNLGNTCFMNSAIQCLSNIPELVEYFRSGQHNKEISRFDEESPETNRGKLASEFGKLLQAMWSGVDAVHNPSEFKHELVKTASRFSGSRQHDAQEFTIFLLDGLHEELNRAKKTNQSNAKGTSSENTQNIDNSDSDMAWEVYKRANDSIVVDLFHGQLKSTLKCVACGIEDVHYDPFCFLSLPVPITTSGATIDDCLSLFTEAEEIERICSRCLHNQFVKKLHVSRLPKFLIVHLKRYEVVNNTTSKIDTSVYFKMRNFNLLGAVADLKDANQKYDIIAAINHSGSISSGHYVASAIRTDSNGQREGYIFNDGSVSKLDNRSIEVDEQGNNNVYMLYYRKQQNSLDNPCLDSNNNNAIPISTDVPNQEAKKEIAKVCSCPSYIG